MQFNTGKLQMNQLTDGQNAALTDCVLNAIDVTIMINDVNFTKISAYIPIKFHTKCIFRNFPTSKIDRTTAFCNIYGTTLVRNIGPTPS